jgi:[ribosomal protein S5]-alanine N-acetyltransferase
MCPDSRSRQLMVLSGSHTYLVPFEERHLCDPRYFEWLNDREVMRYIGRDEYLKPIAFTEVRSYVERLWNNELCVFLAIYNMTDDVFIGTAKISFLDASGQRAGVADIGIMIGDRRYWGKGLSTDVLRTACIHAFDTLGARKLTAGAMATNVAVIKAFRRIGFVQEGRLRRQLMADGELVDHVLLGCLEAELIRE